MSPQMQVEPEAEQPLESPPHDLARITEMVENGVKAAEAGLQAGTVEFHKFAKDAAGVLDHHGFKAWRAAHADETGTGAAELDALEARAVVDPDVEPDDVREARMAEERAAETPEAKAVREAWEAETGKTTHFATAVDPTPASGAAPPADASGATGAQSAEPAHAATPPAAAETETPAV
jgi:hypothetical protein